MLYYNSARHAHYYRKYHICFVKFTVVLAIILFWLICADSCFGLRNDSVIWFAHQIGVAHAFSPSALSVVKFSQGMLRILVHVSIVKLFFDYVPHRSRCVPSLGGSVALHKVWEGSFSAVGCCVKIDGDVITFNKQ